MTALAYQHTNSLTLCTGVVSRIPGMAKYVDLSPYWTEDKGVSIQQAKERTGLDRRTLSAAKKGLLDRSQYDTLYKLREFASELAGRQLTLEELFKGVEE